MARSGPGPRMGFCSQTMLPEVGISRPAIRFNSVLLPHPEWPIKQTNSFFATSIEIESSARKRPLPLAGNAIERSLTLRKAMRSLSEAELLRCPRQRRVKPKANEADQHDRDDHAGELKVVPFVPDEVADPALRADHFRGNDHEPSNPDGNSHAGHDHRHAGGKDDARDVLQRVETEYA